jgi:hypothetical protein
MADPTPPKKTRRRWSAEMITACAAVVIGVSALAVSLYEAGLIREHQRASVWPYLQGGHSWDGSSFRILVENSGIGPARVEAVQLTVDGSPVPDWTGFFQALEVPTSAYTTSQLSGRVLLPGRPLEVLILNAPEMAAATFERWDRVAVRTCYCSVYDECWDTDFIRFRDPVAHCAVDEEQAFEQ